MMAITFPADCTTPRRRVEFCYRAMEKLRLIHNGMGKWRTQGLTETQWDKLPAKIKTRYPYKVQLTESEWQNYKRIVHRKLEDSIAPILTANRDLLKQETQWDMEPTDFVEL